MVVSTFKKGDRADCGNYRGISISNYNHYLRASYTKHSAVSGSSSAVKCREQGCDLYFAFIDLTKAFDSVNRDALWGCHVCLGCPPKFVSVTRQLHVNMKG